MLYCLISLPPISVGEEKDVVVTFPEQYQESSLQGKEAVFKVKLHEMKVKKVNELNDEWVASLGNEEKTVEELRAKGEECDLKEIEQDIAERDQRDMNRETSPLKQAEDAILVDSSEMTIDEVVIEILNILFNIIISPFLTYYSIFLCKINIFFVFLDFLY